MRSLSRALVALRRIQNSLLASRTGMWRGRGARRASLIPRWRRPKEGDREVDKDDT